MLKRYLSWIFVLIMLFVCTGLVSAVSHFPNGIAVGTKAQEATADITPGPGDLYVPGTGEFDGNVRIDGALTAAGGMIEAPQTVSLITTSTGTTITPSSSLIVLSAAVEAKVFGALPYFSTTTPTNYTRIRVFCSSNNVTLYDDDTLAGTQVELVEGTSIVLARDEWVDFYWSGDAVSGNTGWLQDGPVRTLDGVTSIIGAFAAATVNTGQGANELYVMNQNVRTTDEVVFKDITGTYAVKAASAAFSGNVKSGSTGIFEVNFASSIAASGSVNLDGVAGKEGWFTISCGTSTAIGSFSTAAAVTLSTLSSFDTGTSQGTVDHLNIYDGGTSVIVENMMYQTYTIMGTYHYVD